MMYSFLANVEGPLGLVQAHEQNERTLPAGAFYSIAPLPHER